MARILIADDHAVVRMGLRHILEAHDGSTIVGEAIGGGDRFAACARIRGTSSCSTSTCRTVVE